MNKKHLWLGALLLGAGVLASSPLFKTRVEKDLRQRVEKSLADEPSNRYRDVHVSEVDHLDVALAGKVQTEQDRSEVGTHVQREVPGVGRVATDEVTVSQAPKSILPEVESSNDKEDALPPNSLVQDATSNDPADTNPVVAPDTSSMAQVENVPAQVETPESVTSDKDLIEEADEVALAQNSDTAEDEEATPAATDTVIATTTEDQEAVENNEDQTASVENRDDDIPSDEDPFTEPAPDLPSTVSIYREGEVLHLTGVVSDNETKQQLGDAARKAYPDSDIENSISVNSQVVPETWPTNVEPLLTALRKADTKDLRIDIEPESVKISGAVTSDESFEQVGDILANLFGGIVNTSELSVSASETNDEVVKVREADEVPSVVESSEAAPIETAPEAEIVSETNVPDTEAFELAPGAIVVTSDPPPYADVVPIQDSPPTIVEQHYNFETESNIASRASTISKIHALLENKTIFIGEPTVSKHQAFTPGVSTQCRPCPTSISTLPSSLSSSVSLPARSVCTSVGDSGVTAAPTPNKCKTKTNCCVPKSTKPRLLPDKSRCLLKRR